MIDQKSVLAVIPARGGSKGLPKKNILKLADKPLISWSINVAKESKYIDKCIVSTDNKEIKNISEDYGCEVPFIRPLELASDKATTIDTVIHAIEYYRKKNIYYDYFILLEPTSPLREVHDIDDALINLHNKRDYADSIVGVSKIEATHPIFDLRIDDKGLISPYIGEKFRTIRRQDIEPLYFLEGTIYISKIENLLKEKTFYHDRTLSHIVPRWKSAEIDDLSDMLYVESLIKNKLELKNREL